MTLDSSDDSRAAVAIGNAVVNGPSNTPFYAISSPRSVPTVRVAHASAPGGAIGQQTRVSVRVDAKGIRGKTTRVSLLSNSTPLDGVDHRWVGDDEVFEARLPYSPAAPGLSIVRVSATTPGAASAEADVPVVARRRSFGVFIYEPRASWAASFLRRAIEAHRMFETISATQTSRGVATVTSGALGRLTSSQLDEVDAVVASGLEALSAADETELDRFVRIRGGTLILVPDARLPERLREALRLPSLEELLVERAVPVVFEQGKMLASELLLPRTGDQVRTLATVRQGSTERPAVFAVYRGKGQVVVSGALDAWRFRDAPDTAFNSFWQAVVADGAASAAPRLAVEVEPVLAQPGQEITLRVTVRETEWTKTAGGFRLPALTASLVAESGRATVLRLWPGTAAGEYIGRFLAPQQGAYDIRVSADARTHNVLLAVREDAATLVPDRTAALAFMAKSSGGAVVPSTDLERVVSILRGMERPLTERRIHPLRSAWWIVPFAGLLSIEWILRRRTGLR